MPRKLTEKTRAEETEPLDIPTIVDAAIRSLSDKLKGDAGKGTTGDLIRLLQLRTELAPQKRAVVQAKWVTEWDETFDDQ